MGAGGSYVDQRWKEELVSNASQQMAKLQQDTGIKADVFIGSGDVPKVLSQAAKQTKADLLVTGCYPYGGHLRTHCLLIGDEDVCNGVEIQFYNLCLYETQ